MRTFEHVVDTKAVKKTLNAIPDSWVIRDLSERDYGIDLMIEIFTKNGIDENGNPTYKPSGRVVYLQIKGTSQEVEVNKDDTISYQAKKSTLLYVEKFSTPFILVRVFTNEKNKTPIYYTWLQRYILEKIEAEHPNWRENDQESYVIRMPTQNSLPEYTEKIDRIAARIKVLEEHAEFYEKYSLIDSAYEKMISEELKEKHYDDFLNNLRRFKNLSSLLEFNKCQVRKDDIVKLIEYIEGIKNGKHNPNTIDDFPGSVIFNLNMLKNQNFMRMIMENLEAENDRDTVY